MAIVKVGGTAEMIRPAAQRFLHQQDRIEAFTGQVLAGALRSVIGRLTVEEIIRDRAAFAAHVAEEAERALTHQGLVLDAFQLEDIRAAGTYLQDLGRLGVGETVAECLNADLRLESGARTDLVAAAAACEAAQDYVSREIAVDILEDAESHIDFLETELALLEKVGEPNYLQTQIGEGKEPD